MIKRSGVEIMNARTGNVSLAKETIEVCKAKQYTNRLGEVVDFSQEMEAALKGTVYYPDSLGVLAGAPIVPTIEVTNETTAEAAVRLAGLGKDNLVALNFAAARNQGGGFLSGALAQEEDLCRASGLYPCLKSKPLFYNANILAEDTFYTDGVIYSPKVPFFRDKHNLFLDKPFTLSIVSAPAPNLNGVRPEGFTSLCEIVIRTRAQKVLQIAAAQGHKNIILGAWGCGAFGNDPKLVAHEFQKVLEKVPLFEHVCFAVYDIRTPPHLYETFKAQFSTNEE